MTDKVAPKVGDVLLAVDGGRRWVWNGSAWVEVVPAEQVLARLGVLLQRWRQCGVPEQVACADEVESCLGVWRWGNDDGQGPV